MARRLSRRAVTTYVAKEIAEGNTKVIASLAAYLVETHQTRNLELFVRDIEYLLASHGHTIVDVTSAFSLTEKTTAEITRFVRAETGAKKVYLREKVDTSVLGGFRLGLPGRELDVTLARHLTILRTRFKKA